MIYLHYFYIRIINTYKAKLEFYTWYTFFYIKHTANFIKTFRCSLSFICILYNLNQRLTIQDIAIHL